MSTDEKIAALTAEIDKLKAERPTPVDPAAVARWKDEMHQMAERRASASARSTYSRDQLAAMDAAVSRADLADIIRHGTVQPPSAAGASGQITKSSSNAGLPGSNTGWRTATPLGPPEGTAILDRQMPREDAEFRRERVREAALLKSADKAK